MIDILILFLKQGQITESQLASIDSWNCEYCPKKYKQYGNLHRHKITCHSEILEPVQNKTNENTLSADDNAHEQSQSFVESSENKKDFGCEQETIGDENNLNGELNKINIKRESFEVVNDEEPEVLEASFDYDPNDLGSYEPEPECDQDFNQYQSQNLDTDLDQNQDQNLDQSQNQNLDQSQSQSQSQGQHQEQHLNQDQHDQNQDQSKAGSSDSDESGSEVNDWSYLCNICKESFDQIDILKKHMSTHKKKKKKSKLKEPNKINPKESSHKGNSEQNKDDFKHNEGDLNGISDDFRSNEVDLQQSEVDFHQNEDDFQQDEDDFNQNEVHSLQNSEETNTEEAFYNEDESDPAREIAEEYENQCPCCDKSYKSGPGVYHLKNHIKRFHPKACVDCWQVFENINELADHRLNVHALIDQPNSNISHPVDPDNPEAFVEAFLEELPEIKVKREKPNKTRGTDQSQSKENCQYCFKTFKNYRSLAIHLGRMVNDPVHSQRKKLESEKLAKKANGVMCKVCYKVFKNTRSLQIHESAHRKEVSSLNTNAQSVVDSHMTDSEDLEEVETDNDIIERIPKSSKKTKDLVCAACGKVFKIIGFLMNHIKKHHPTSMCRFCFLIFDNVETFNDHMDQFHPYLKDDIKTEREGKLI